MFSRSFSVKNIPPKVPYLLRASARQWHTIHTLSSFLSPHSRQSCNSVNPGLNIQALRVVWPVNSPTATLSFSALIAWSSFVLPERGSLIRVLDWRQPLQFFLSVQVLLPQITTDDFFTHNKRNANSLVRKDTLLGLWTAWIQSICPAVPKLHCCYLKRILSPSTVVNASSFKTRVISYHTSVFQESIKLLHFFSECNNK